MRRLALPARCLLWLTLSYSGWPPILCQAGDNPAWQEAVPPLQSQYRQWQHARDPAEKRRLGQALYGAAVRAHRPDMAEEAAAGGPMADRQIAVRRRARQVPLRVLRTLDGPNVNPADGEHESAPNQGQGWLARRITPDALEVWTPRHGWLFDGRGRLLHEARAPQSDTNMGREWYGAFLPDGRWATTEPTGQSCDGLSINPAGGELLRRVPEPELAPEVPYRQGVPLLGWARSNRAGTAWVVNVGSEEGYATVEIGPEGPARTLSGVERWQACYPRALGMRGFYITAWVPDDAGGTLLKRDAAGHGPDVGYPGYSLVAPKQEPVQDMLDDGQLLGSVPSGNDIAGFWPGRRDVYIGATRFVGVQGSHRALEEGEGESRTEEATWFFDARSRFRGWLRGRRMADAADGRAMLFRLEAGREIVTLRPDLRAADVRRFTWDDGTAALALSVFDDLRLGLFEHGGKLVLAAW